MPNDTTLGEFIRDKRLALGLNQGEFADMAGINRAHLSQVENGRIGLPQPDMRRKIASALGIPHVDLLIVAGELEPDEAGGRDPFANPTSQNDKWAYEIYTLARGVDWDDRRLNVVMAILATWIDEDRTGWRRHRGTDRDAGAGSRRATATAAIAAARDPLANTDVDLAELFDREAREVVVPIVDEGE